MEIIRSNIATVNQDEFEKTCRLCGMQANYQMEDIFDDNKDTLEKISFCVPVIIGTHDLFPKKICDICLLALDSAFNFVTKCLATDKKFRQDKEVHVRYVDINSLPVNGPVECDICKIMFSNMNLFDKHTEEHMSNMKSILQFAPTTPDALTNKRGIKEYYESEVHRNKERKKGTLIKQELEDNMLKNDDKEELVNKIITDSNINFEEDLADTRDNKLSKRLQKKLFICNFCSEQFQNSKELKTHSLQTHNVAVNTEWVCKFCNKSMTTKVGLLIHERIHDGTKPYICEWCGNGFRSRANLTQHQVIHTGVRKYSCTRCNKKFSRRSFVETHMRVHTGERPYCCDICGYRFTQIGDMRRHRNKHQTYSAFSSTSVNAEKLKIS